MRRRNTYLWRAACVLGLALVILAIADEGIRSSLDTNAPLASWGVALGTFVLALATFQLARRARDEATRVGEQVALQRKQMEASRRSYLFPWAPDDWAMGTGFWVGKRSTMLPLKNGGPGLALNVRGRVVWNRSPGDWSEIEILAGSIAANDVVNARTSHPAATDWVGTTGYVKYTDEQRRDWVTFFRFDQAAGGHIWGKHLPTESAADKNDPDSMDAATIAAKMR